ncbi:hypothetical protein CVT25_003759 [Psilocybe cyanescens]|uniref:G domain-containing protein n=1 Tax=Psilocybe cyanescens TaxID=93625 RepID=A0A409XW61_PSICY|nr:hypothetical protein CVT25_003759 [Psilocybe cyanescens]
MSANCQNPAKGSKVEALGNRLKKALGLGSSSAGLVSRNEVGLVSRNEAAELRSRYTHFRVPVIGRANAGKTTLLKRVCNTTEEPSIYDDGKNLRGIHDVHRTFTFKSNPKFIFHDSPGFEAGGEEELKAVMDFIEEHSKAHEVNDQIHLIWFCFDPDVSRPLLDLEVKFFNENRKWNVPVVAIFMKFDDLISQVWNRNNTPEQNTKHALDTLQQKFELPLRSYQFSPWSYVRLEELIKQTAASIDDLALKMLFVSVQQNNLKICIEYAIKNFSIVHQHIRNMDDLIFWAISWFPHYYYVCEYATAL